MTAPFRAGMMLPIMRIRWLAGVFVCAWLGACAAHPPVEEMAAARRAVEAARALPGDGAPASALLKSAEEALAEAARAMQARDYRHARTKALEARRAALRAAALKRRNDRRKQ